jgi:hypothetical protein
MTSKPEPMIQPRHHEFQHLLAYGTGPDGRSQTAATGESPLCRRLLAPGAALWRLFCVIRAAVRPAEPVPTPDGVRLTYHDQRPTTDDAVFGQVRFARPGLTPLGQEGRGPCDAERSVLARGYADLRREWATFGTTNESARERQTVLERIVGLPLSLRALATSRAEAGRDMTRF